MIRKNNQTYLYFAIPDNPEERSVEKLTFNSSISAISFAFTSFRDLLIITRATLLKIFNLYCDRKRFDDVFHYAPFFAVSMFPGIVIPRGEDKYWNIAPLNLAQFVDTVNLLAPII